LSSDYSAKYLQQLWKKVRKQGGLCTGISQNVTDLLQNYVAATLISNSEFIVLLKQSNIDSRKLSEAIGVSDAQLRYVSNSPAGTGLIKCGNTIIPFDNTIIKDSKLYQMYNTNLHEKIEQGLIDYADDFSDVSDIDANDGDVTDRFYNNTDGNEVEARNEMVSSDEDKRQASESWLIY
jgi:hypothetical protein